MSKLERFLKQNKAQRPNVFYAATKSLRDEKGEPLLWELRHLSARENDAIREACTVEVPLRNRPNQFRMKLDTARYIARMAAACVVAPDLYDAQLQDSYGVNTPEELIREMVDDCGEYTELVAFIQRMNGFDSTFEEKVEEAKN